MNPTLEPIPMNPPKAPAKFTKLRSDRHGDREGWAWVFVIGIEGELESYPEDPNKVSEDEMNRICRWMADEHDWHVRPGRERGPGQPYAEEPWFDFYPTTLVIRQCGGLDV